MVNPSGQFGAGMACSAAGIVGGSSASERRGATQSVAQERIGRSFIQRVSHAAKEKVASEMRRAMRGAAGVRFALAVSMQLEKGNSGILARACRHPADNGLEARPPFLASASLRLNGQREEEGRAFVHLG